MNERTATLLRRVADKRIPEKATDKEKNSALADLKRRWTRTLQSERHTLRRALTAEIMG